MLYDSMLNKINPRTLGNVGNRGNLVNDDSIAKHAKQIGKSGPVNSNTQSRIENHADTRHLNMVTTPDYEQMRQMISPDLEMRNG